MKDRALNGPKAAQNITRTGGHTEAKQADSCRVLAGDVPVFNSEVLEQFVRLKGGEENLTLHRRQVHVKVFSNHFGSNDPGKHLC